MNKHVFLMVIPYNFVKHLFSPLRGLSNIIVKLFPNLPRDLKKADYDYIPQDYVTAGMVSYFFLSSVFGLLMGWLALTRERPANVAFALGFASFAGILLLLSYLLVRMPSIQSKSRSNEVNKYLLYALKDVELQIRAGTPLFNALDSVAHGDYNVVSQDFAHIVDRVSVGIPMKDALEDLVHITESEYMKKALWQMINSLRAGADLRSGLASIIRSLQSEQRSQIMNYSRELNLWSLLYMLFAVAIPTIGSTMMVILSTFAGFGISRGMFIIFIIVCFVIQFIMVNFIKTRRPVVQF